jgi:putative transcriptional regulator
MLSDNIKILRKKKGYSQETLAEQLHVVRQTISKWEKGISVPDAVMLDRMAAEIEMAELFEVPVSVLLGGGLEVEEE